MARDVYTADMGQPPSDDDMGSIESLALRGKRRPMAGRPAAPAPVPARPMPGAPVGRDLGQLEDDMGSIESLRPKTGRQVKAAKDIKAAMGMKCGGKVKKMKSGGSTGSASKRADGIASKGKTKGRFV